jgi:hypothetical protein
LRGSSFSDFKTTRETVSAGGKREHRWDVAGDEGQAEHLRELHAACCGKLEGLRAAAAAEPSSLIDALEQIKSSIEDELGELGESLRP